MSLTRFAPVALSALLLLGCGSTPENYIEPEEHTAAPEANAASMKDLMNQSMRTTELGVSNLKDPAKTVGYAAGSTEPGEKLMDGVLFVEHVARQDADLLRRDGQRLQQQGRRGSRVRVAHALFTDKAWSCRR
jgi:hypothetical protein